MVCVIVCACVCVGERERSRDRESVGSARGGETVGSVLEWRGAVLVGAAEDGLPGVQTVQVAHEYM